MLWIWFRVAHMLVSPYHANRSSVDSKRRYSADFADDIAFALKFHQYAPFLDPGRRMIGAPYFKILNCGSEFKQYRHSAG